MILCEFMQQQIPDLPRVPKNVESFGRISVVEYVLFHYQYKHHFLGSIQSWKKGSKPKKPSRKAQFVLHFCVSMESKINWQNNACNRLFKV